MQRQNVEITIKEAQEIVDNWIKTIGVRYFNELTNMAVLTEEVGEVARINHRILIIKVADVFGLKLAFVINH